MNHKQDTETGTTGTPRLGAEDRTQAADKKACSCPYCGGPTVEADDTRMAWCRPCRVEINHCPDCGAPIPKDDTTCPHCGGKKDERKQQQ